MSEDQKAFFAFLGIVISIFVVAFAYNLGYFKGERYTRQEAIKAGAAVWSQDEEGAAVIKWLNPNKKEVEK